MRKVKVLSNIVLYRCKSKSQFDENRLTAVGQQNKLISTLLLARFGHKRGTGMANNKIEIRESYDIHARFYETVLTCNMRLI